MQHFDGTLEEFGPDEWLSTHPTPAQAPEDWSGSVDISHEDLLPGAHHTLVRDWQSELELIDDIRRKVVEFE